MTGIASYKQNICNVPNCSGREYRHHMCQKHYDFYSMNPLTAKYITEAQALEDGTAKWKLKGKVLLQGIIHYLFAIPMPLISHFPLEHVFLGELFSLRNNKDIDSNRIQQVIKDFNIPENENLSDMQIVLNIRDIETSEIGPKENCLLEKKDLPSKWPIILSVIGVTLLYCFFKWFANDNVQIGGVDLCEIVQVFWQYIPYLVIFIFFSFLGLIIPSQYNFFIEKSYKMTLFKDVRDNVDVVNYVKHVKERKERSKSYYAATFGCVLGVAVILFSSLLGHGLSITWSSVLLSIAVVLAVVPLLYSYNEMVLFYPVIKSLTKKRVEIDLYNADHRGGLKKYFRFLYLTFLYNEGVSVVLITLLVSFPISKWWVFLLLIILMPRFNHAGWVVIGWVRSILDFYKEKKAERNRLILMEGSAMNMDKMELLKKVHPTGLIPLVLKIVVIFLIPYLVNQMPKWPELLNSLIK